MRRAKKVEQEEVPVADSGNGAAKKINKSQAIRDAIAENTDLQNKEIAEMLNAKYPDMKFTNMMVGAIRGKEKLKAEGGKPSHKTSKDDGGLWHKLNDLMVLRDYFGKETLKSLVDKL